MGHCEHPPSTFDYFTSNFRFVGLTDPPIIRNPELYKPKAEWTFDHSLPPGLQAKGSPVHSGTVRMTVTSIRNAITERSDPRRHARPMSIEDMKAIFSWSLQEVPADPTELLKDPKLSMDTLDKITLHLFWRALSSLAFRLWTRYILFLCT